MREPILSETPAAFRRIPNRSAAVETLADKSDGREGKGLKGKGIPAPPSLSEKNSPALFNNRAYHIRKLLAIFRLKLELVEKIKI